MFKPIRRSGTASLRFLSDFLARSIVSNRTPEESVIFSVSKKKVNMSNEQKARKWLDSIVKGQNGGTKSLKSVMRSRARLRAPRDDRPLNVLGCFALIHAIRSVSGCEQSTLGNRPATPASLQ